MKPELERVMQRDRDAALAMKVRGGTAHVICRKVSNLIGMLPTETACSCPGSGVTLDCYQDALIAEERDARIRIEVRRPPTPS